ncbi:hypothetical protein B0H15DRAFT_1021534 [Mycena belliarum]|uniref:Uncharacterized protein n=1 Tax=Mycena belliarum TaxID=1033014 RepID=A0AAD6UB55_9AGAR|nr:hypothetical protein B0H15DRAFT_1021534 [Mycena belliae]
MLFTVTVDLFAAFLRIFLTRTFAYSRTLNTRNIESYWYPLWNHTLLTLVGNIPHLCVAPQYTLWCVPDDLIDDPEPPPQGDGEERALAPADGEDEVAGDHFEAVMDDNWAAPPEAPELEEDEEDEYNPLADLSMDSTRSVKVSKKYATTQITDFAVVHLATETGTDTSLTSAIGRIFTALLAGSIISEAAAVLRSRRAELPIGQQMPRILVEIKRYIHRHYLPGEKFNATMQLSMRDAQVQLGRQATALFYMPEATAKTVILVAAVGPYYSTAYIRRKKRVDPAFVKEKLNERSLRDLVSTVTTPRWSSVRYLGTESSNRHLEKIQGHLRNWAEFEERVCR